MLPSNIVDMQELGQVYIEEKGESIPVGEQYNNVKDYTYTEINGRIYYRINDYLYEQNKNQTAIERIKGLIKVKTALKNLIDIENKDVSDGPVIQEIVADYYRDPKVMIDDRDELPAEENEEEEHVQFDIRQAIISSEILKRPQY